MFVVCRVSQICHIPKIERAGRCYTEGCEFLFEGRFAVRDRGKRKDFDFVSPRNQAAYRGEHLPLATASREHRYDHQYAFWFH